MNENLRQLAISAQVEHCVSHVRLEEFAELIVRECARRVDYWESRQGEHADDILRHFGIDIDKGEQVAYEI